MQYKLAALLLFATLASPVAFADISNSFVRVACVPEAGLLDVQWRSLHDSVSSENGANGRIRRGSPLGKAGFHDPHGFNMSCALGSISYQISTTQAEQTNFNCGGSPDIYLTVTRNGKKLLSDVILGGVCARAAVTRITIGDGPKSWGGRETEVCYWSGESADTEHCDWTSGAAAVFDKRFPVDDARVRKIVSGEERR